MSSIFINENDFPIVMIDNGYTIPANGTLTVEDRQKLAQSFDAIAVLSMPGVRYNDGLNDLSKSDAIDHIRGYAVKTVATYGIQEPNGRRFRGRGILAATVLAVEATKTFYYDIVGEGREINGVIIETIRGRGDFDHVSFYVVKRPGNLGNETLDDIVLDDFVDNWYVPNAAEILQLYRAYLPPGVSIKIVYHSTQSLEDTLFYVNALLHKRPAI